MSTANVLKSIQTERQRQKDKGHTLKSDAENNNPGILALAAAAYAAQTGTVMANPVDSVIGVGAPALWPFAPDRYKQRGFRENLVVAAAMLVAEIERFDNTPDSDKQD